MIKPLLIASFEAALNRYLTLDENSQALLYPLIGKIIAVNIQPFNETVYLCPSADSIQIIDHLVGEPDTAISGSLWALGLMGVSAKPMRSVFSGEVKIEGDIHTGKQFQSLFKKLNIDPESLLTQYTGGEIAGRVIGFFRAGQDWSKETLETFRLNAAEFLQEETRDLPAKPEIDIFYHEVDDVRLGCERLESRIERLTATLNSK